MSKLDKKINEIKKEDISETNDFKTVNKNEVKPSIIKLPFIHLVKKLGLSRPLVEALKVEYDFRDSTQISKDELIKKSEKWLCGKPHQENNRRVK